MGVDVEIYFKSTAEDPRLWWPLPDGYAVQPLTDREWAPPGATHEVDTIVRYYGPGYDRGPWPEICSVLLDLLASPDITDVWYCGDSGGCEADGDWDKARVDADFLHQMNLKFITEGNHNYSGALR